MNAVMDTTDPTAAGASPSSSAHPSATPSAGVAIFVFGTAAWLGWLWAVTIVGNAIALAAVARWGHLDQSLWMQAGAGWQRWPIAVAGYLTVSVFLPMFVTHGATRRLLSRSAAIGMAIIAISAAAIVTVGFWLEGLVFDREDWTHVVDAGGRMVADVGLPTILVAYALGFAAWFVGGWLLAAGSLPGFLAGLVTVLTTELLVLNQFDSTQFDFLDSLDVLSLAAGIPISVVVTVAAVVLATRMTSTRAVA